MTFHVCKQKLWEERLGVYPREGKGEAGGAGE